MTDSRIVVPRALIEQVNVTVGVVSCKPVMPQRAERLPVRGYILGRIPGQIISCAAGYFDQINIQVAITI